MNQSRAFITSLMFAGLGMLMVYFYVANEKENLRKRFGADVTVVVAAKDINEMEEIQPNMLTTKVVPGEFVQPESLPDPKAFEGAVAASPFKKGEQILRTKVLKKGADTGLASQVAISRRAISIPVTDETGVSKLVKPGDRIDLLANVAYDGGSEVKTFLQNVHVLSIGEVIQNHTPQAFDVDPLTGNPRAVNLRGNRSFTSVTVEVTPEEAQQIIYITQVSGQQIYMTLRNPVDRMVASVPTTTVDEVLGPNSKKAQEEARKRIVPQVARPVAPPPPPPNPWAQGGGTFAK